ncbi:MAG TPA: acyltransferase [Rickettsiales bacterium]|nr:acyltransferase [Rickettsiales bacterium]
MTDTPHGLSMTQISRAIGLSRIVLIVGLVFLHYDLFPNSLAIPFEGLDVHEHRFVTWLNSTILFFFFSAVPLLSMVSGWLFFSFMAEDAWPSIFRRMRRRFTSLYLPLVVWNLGYLALIYTAFHFNPHASVFSHANRFNIDFFTADWKNYADSIFAISDNSPIAFQFWFVRDLFLTALISPLYWILLSRAPWLGAAALCAIWISGWDMVIFVRSDVPFFFYLGALIHQKRLPLTVPLKVAISAAVIFIMLAGLRALAPYVVDFSQHVYPFWLNAATRLMRLLGVVGCWGIIYRLAQTKRGATLANLGGVAFFLHSAHWPLLGIIKSVVWKFMPGDSDAWMMVHYFISVSITVFIGAGGGLALAKFAPRCFALMNGGRLLGQTRNAEPQTATAVSVPETAPAMPAAV